MYQSISINDPEFKQKLIHEYTTNGLAVINDVLLDQECDIAMTNIIDDFVKLGSGIDKDNIENTWTTFNLPPQTRPGLFQAMMSNLQQVWDIRSNEKIKNIFEILYSHLRNKEVKDFIVSGDGINVKPGNVKPFKTKQSTDWAHVDQTIKGDIYKCIQGQAVLTNTSASFVASPKSHLIFDDIITTLNHNSTSNWLKFSEQEIKTIKPMILKKGGQFQIPILSKKGSFIVWSSTLIHSAKLQDQIEYPSTEDIYNGWRGIVYVCYRPKEEFSSKDLQTRITVYETNRTTNHWSTKVFNKKPGSRYLYIEKKHAEIEMMMLEPKLVYDKISKPVLNDDQLKLLGLL